MLQKTQRLIGWKSKAAAFLLWIWGLPPSAESSSMPWQDGERLKFSISCGPVRLGHLKLLAEKAVSAPETWSFTAHFRSSPAINKVLPVDGVDSRLISQCEANPWRSLRYQQDRKEGPSHLQRTRVLRYQKTQVQGAWGYQGVFHRGLEEKEISGEPFLFLEDSLEDPVSLLYRIRRDLLVSKKIPEKLSLIENKKLIRLKITEKGQSGNQVRVVLKEAPQAKPGMQIPKELEISFRSFNEPVPLEAKLVWGIFTVRFEAENPPALDLEKQ